MPLRVRKVANIIENRVMPVGRAGANVAAILINFPPTLDPLPSALWQADLLIGMNEGAGRVWFDLPPLLSKSHDLSRPVYLGENLAGDTIVFFHDRLFMPDRAPLNAIEREEVELRIKKMIHEEAAEITLLRATVASMEAVIEYRHPGARRIPIPEHVKLLVWARDGGACVHCGAQAELHFDHIIPVAKGGGNTEANIQILCQTCNLRKSDKIAVV